MSIIYTKQVYRYLRVGCGTRLLHSGVMRISRWRLFPETNTSRARGNIYFQRELPAPYSRGLTPPLYKMENRWFFIYTLPIVLRTHVTLYAEHQTHC